ncbi:MAG: DUF2232 domain-containing protein [cyanobacterium endosymbiont of Rhopalodia musculus]|uniref:DUF2232 domain-containing protein n=1 Tax=cyanobacterium endosymbiont of Epithemia clementina EcSB TaxID=3034674 RepID=UPI002481810D|nr:DUF2232 domain-containing protein [cyanobacterium endosymbiont of Epithemia clementina EcSB]WGT68013.1 DUF2232 domain-containing protein [cyanobacterium endosymbiont of Epithemia clementina EcSB]
MNYSSDNANPGSDLESNALTNSESNWVDDDTQETVTVPVSNLKNVQPLSLSKIKESSTLAIVETAFLASACSLIWLINYYFPLGPFLRIFFPIPIALIYLRWGHRAAWMGALVSGLLLTVLMGPTRSVVFLMPYGLMGVQLGYCWRRRTSWLFSMVTGALIGTFGFFFRFWLFSILLGEDLWQYMIIQITELAQWLFIKSGILSQPSFSLIQLLTIGLVILNSLIYLSAVHLVALLVLEKLGNPIPQPPRWIQIIVDYKQ